MQQNENANQTETAELRSGVFSVNNSKIVGMTVSEVRDLYSAKFNIASDTTSFNGKAVVDASYVIKPGDQIEFTRATGEKGA